MSFLFPTLLFFGILAAVPFIIHLFGERNYKPLPFSSLKFLREIEQESMRRLQWKRWLILLLRALFIILLVLILAQPFFHRSKGVLDRGLIILDKSFSTQIDLDYTDKTTRLIQDLPGWDVLQYDQRDVIDSIIVKAEELCDKNSGLTNIVVVSDFQNNEQNIDLLKKLDKLEQSLSVLPVQKEALNISIADLQEMQEEDPSSRRIALFLSQNMNEETLNANIYINSRRVGKAYSSGSEYVDYFISELDEGEQFCMVEGPEDDYPEDNKRYLILKKENNIKLLLLEDQNQNSSYVFKALSAMENIVLKLSSFENISKHNLNDYDMVWINALSEMPVNFQKSMIDYAKSHPLVLSVSKELPKHNIWEDYSGKLQAFNSKEGFINFHSTNDIERNFKIKRYYKTNKNDTENIWELDSGEPLLFKSVDELYILLAPFDFEWNEMGLSPYFLKSLNNFILGSLGSNKLQYELGDIVKLNKGFTEVTTPGGSKFNVKGEFSNTDIAGFYSFRNADKEWSIAVNPSKEECEQSMINLNAYNILEYDHDNPQSIAEQIRGRKGQTLFFLFALLCIIFELFLTRKGESTE